MKTYKKAIIVVAAMVATSILSVEAGYLFADIFNDFSTDDIVAKKDGSSNSPSNRGIYNSIESIRGWEKNATHKQEKTEEEELALLANDDDDDSGDNDLEVEANDTVIEEAGYELTDQEKATHRVNQALRKIEKAEETIANKEAQGKDTTKAQEELAHSKELLLQAQEALNNEDYEGATNIAKDAKHAAALARSKYILSLSPRAQIAHAFGKCISSAAQAKNFEAFAGCHAEFKGEINEQIEEELSEEDQLANEEISAKIDELFNVVYDQELIDILHGFKEYNFSGVDSAEVIAKLDEIINSEMTTEEKAAALTELLNNLKDQSAEEKFEDDIIPFLDTDDEDWYFAYADILKEENCIEGYVNEDGTLTGKFRPADPVLFGDSLKFVLSCMLDEDLTETQEPTFWAVGWALTLVNEYSEYVDANFIAKTESAIENPAEFAEGLTRANIIAFLFDILETEIPEALEAPFSDVPLVHPYVNEIAYALELGIISGDEATGEFRPNAVPNRAEMIKILIMMKELSNGETSDDGALEEPAGETPATELPATEEAFVSLF